MKVLFIRSGNRGVDPITTRQAKSITKLGPEIVFYNIIGTGFWGYLKNLSKLRSKIKVEKPDIIHAHYSLSGYLASLTFTKKPIVVSLMGSDVIEAKWAELAFLKYSCNHLWKQCIVKSEEISQKLNIKSSLIIPNGVDLDDFQQIDKLMAQKKLGWSPDKIHILFASGKDRPEKNFHLASEGLGILKNELHNIELHFLVDIKIDAIPLYYNASDVLLLTSKHEGSPNVIKEAMACNCPIVATKVGDVEYVLNKVEGCYITDFDPKVVASSLKKAIEFGKRTNGRQKIKEINLDTVSVSQRILNTYNSVKK